MPLIPSTPPKTHYPSKQWPLLFRLNRLSSLYSMTFYPPDLSFENWCGEIRKLDANVELGSMHHPITFLSLDARSIRGIFLVRSHGWTMLVDSEVRDPKYDGNGPRLSQYSINPFGIIKLIYNPPSFVLLRRWQDPSVNSTIFTNSAGWRTVAPMIFFS